ncbi:integrase [Kutzneria buriramensis]|uniref:Core-binding (CB) domain-containing protein n=1 Tax=Kutzneria buriramensis TaxID=1045776 RepID=A0A3E0HLT4_9PSEU|nr:integrase [Kutzneria buriramensis]REH47367.1 hypothetical protein BCF44_106532 [Kutzneria buriramensis]
MQRAARLSEERGWPVDTLKSTSTALVLLFANRPAGERVPYSEIARCWAPRMSAPRVVDVLTDLDLLDDDRPRAIRTWIDTKSGTLPPGFRDDVRAWLLWMLDGDERTQPRSQASLYVYFGQVRPLIEGWSSTRTRLREVTKADVDTALAPLRGHQLRNAITALRSLMRFARKHRLVFADPARHLNVGRDVQRTAMPMTDEQIAETPAQRLVVALAAVHAARAKSIRELTLDDVDLANRRITIAGNRQRLGELAHAVLLAWMEHRRATWPHTANRHVLVSRMTALGLGPVSHYYLKKHLLLRGVHLELIRGDRVLQEALATGADPLHLAVMFNLHFTTAIRYADIARRVLDGRLEPDTRS